MPDKGTCLAITLWLIFTLGFIGIPLVLLILEVVVRVRLEPATCRIKERVNTDFYEIFVIPESDSEPFSEVVEVTVKDSDDTFEEGQELECFFRIDTYDGGTDVVVQFHSDRESPNIVTVVIYSVWLAMPVVVICGILLLSVCDIDIAAVGSSVA